LFRQGYDILTVAEQLDHKNIESTRQYLKASGVSSKKIMERDEPKW
jgi:site-specific recombinase XerD